MTEIKWNPYPETKPEAANSYRKLYLVTMKSDYRRFVTDAEWCRATIKGTTFYRWEYHDRVFFPWDVIAWADFPEPYQTAEGNK